MQDKKPSNLTRVIIRVIVKTRTRKMGKHNIVINELITQTGNEGMKGIGNAKKVNERMIDITDSDIN